MNRSGSEKRIKIKSVPCRLSVDEHIQITEKAKASGLTVSAFMRSAALGKHVKAPTDLKLINELRRLGGLQKKLLAEGVTEHNREIIDVLIEIKKTLKRAAQVDS